MPLSTDIHCIDTKKWTRKWWEGNIKLQNQQYIKYFDDKPT